MREVYLGICHASIMKLKSVNHFRKIALSLIINRARNSSIRKGILRHFGKFKGKHLCQSLFFNKVADLRPVTLLKKRLWHRCFPANFAKCLTIPFLQNTSGRLLLQRPKYASGMNYKLNLTN